MEAREGASRRERDLASGLVRLRAGWIGALPLPYFFTLKVHLFLALTLPPSPAPLA
jgi:hypothetical protein